MAGRRISRDQYIGGLVDIVDLLKDCKEPAIIHTDQVNVYYSSMAYNELIRNTNIVRSMSTASKPTANPVNEAMNGWIKEELFVDFKIEQCRSRDEFWSAIERYTNGASWNKSTYSFFSAIKKTLRKSAIYSVHVFCDLKTVSPVLWNGESPVDRMSDNTKAFNGIDVVLNMSHRFAFIKRQLQSYSLPPKQKITRPTYSATLKSSSVLISTASNLLTKWIYGFLPILQRYLARLS